MSIHTDKITLIILTAAVFTAAVFYVFPLKVSASELKWEKRVEDPISKITYVLQNENLRALSNEKIVYNSKKEEKVEDFIVCDIDKDGDNELLVLCDKKGKFGKHMPFWVKENDDSISQHIFIYECDNGIISPKWMSSDIGLTVSDWWYDGASLVLKDECNVSSYWTWKTWGLEKAEEYVTLLFVGDNIIHSPIIRRAEKHGMDFDYAYNKITLYISKMDVSVVVSETPLVDRKSDYGDYPRFGTPKEIALSLKKTGFDIAACATNHVLDRGAYGLECTKREYERVGILPLGIDDDRVTIKEIKGNKIAFINYTGVINTQKTDVNTVYKINYLGDEDEIRSVIKEAKSHADFVVMIVHWGTEYSREIDENQKRWAKIFLEEGVDLCIGSHPHVVGDVKMQSDGTHNMLTYYSLGNFFSSQNKEGTDKGMMAYVALGIKEGKLDILTHKEYEVDINKDGVVLNNK